MQADNFSVRWSGQVLAPVTGTYTFTTTSDDGVRLYVNGQLLIDNWTDHAVVAEQRHDRAGRQSEIQHPHGVLRSRPARDRQAVLGVSGPDASGRAPMGALPGACGQSAADGRCRSGQDDHAARRRRR